MRRAAGAAATIILLGAGGCGRREGGMKDLTGCLATGQTLDLPLAAGGSASFRVAFDGFGCNSVAESDGTPVLRLRPASAADPTATHASLVLGPASDADLNASVGVTTLRQIRTGGKPNPHEVGWLIWRYVDNDHFYYLAAKPNGWELGKREPGHPGGQEFLATGSKPEFATGLRHELRVTQKGATIDAWIDGVHLVTYTDPSPYMTGRIGLYCEDSDVIFDGLALTNAP